MNIPGTFNYQGQAVDPVATQNALNAAGIYITCNESGPCQATVDLGNITQNGFLGELYLPPHPNDRMRFIDDPAWKHWLKVLLIAAVIGLVVLDGYKLLK